MKTKLFFLILLAFTTALFAFRFNISNTQVSREKTKNEFKKQTIVRCSPDWKELKEWLEEVDIPPIPGAGIYKWKISTKSDSAQFYFNQGINMYYSFHIIEAMASFKKAEKFDPGSAMLYWAQALTYGPNINDFGYRASPDALAAVNKSKDLASVVTPFEKELIDAQSVRYTADSADATRATLNQAYVDKMKKVFKNYLGNPDALALYADAMMLQHPWDLWNVDGTPKQWTPLIRDVLEKLLAKSPNHPGGNHYYIHVMEPSPFFAKALPSAERLGKTNPGLSHVVHMPSHIYLRTGNYQKGVDVNINAINSYERSILLYSPVTGADFLYLIHNVHMKTNNAMLGGQQKVSIQSALATTASIPADYYQSPAPMGNYIQYLSMTPVFAYIRFAKWDDILQMKQPYASLIYSNVLYHFGRGMALANQLKIPEAKGELQQLRELMKDSSLAIPLAPFSSALEGAVVAENLLAGTIELKQNNLPAAISFFKKAVITEENMVYNEPRDWILNPKPFLGNVFLLSKKWIDAEKVFLSDLKNNNENGWSLYGLFIAAGGRNDKTKVDTYQNRYKKAFAKSDLSLSSSLY